MPLLLQFVFLIVLLFSLVGARNLISGHLQNITYRLTGSRKAGIVIYSLIFFPGVIIHELSHFFAAAITGVKTGTITIFPETLDYGPQAGRQRLGSVQVAKTDPVRTGLIGIAPFIVGSLTIISLTYWQFPQVITSLVRIENPLNHFLIESRTILQNPLNLVWIYLIFSISNTMFISKSDRRAFPALITLILLVLGLIVWLDLGFSLTSTVSPPLAAVTSILTAAFFVTLIIDVLVLTFILAIQAIVLKYTYARQKH